MNAIYNPDYTVSSRRVNLIYESEAATLSRLESLYSGQDLVQASMGKALSVGGNAQEVLTARLDDELDQLLLESSADESNIITVSSKISDEDLERQLQSMRQRYANNAKLADDWETKIYSDIHSYDFKAMGIEIKPVIDFITLQFEVNKPTTRHSIKKQLTEKTGTRYYIQNDEGGIEQSSNVFTIKQVHDVRSRKDLKAIIQCLERYGVAYGEIKVTRIEVSLDFYNVKSKALLIALHKSLAYFENSINERIYKTEKVFTPMPKTSISLLEKLEKGYCIGVNPDGSPAYHTSYHKTTDRGLNLHESEHRSRTEVNCAVSEFGVDDSLSNLPEIIQCAFNRLKFTRFSKNATADDKKLYQESVDTFGKQTKKHYSISRHKRNFNQMITKNGELNKVISRKVSDLKRNFKE
ncbi:hypothetical protein E2K73_00535 [Acinetobacter sp. RF15A]|uniref:hypothetical protein n=1 Tax=unclassified Acinetobacter TaxID=196816 RepID=UPI0011917769|nr:MULTISPECIES: hypothetical protein [unclassified Acinetobacter]TSH78438.1 hypothetical protein E2K73_00535 [Acinetobacter sp. RF15A]TSI20766.1 hypothetical protein E2K74_01960 [Acinetobacter sp. RF15B]